MRTTVTLGWLVAALLALPAPATANPLKPRWMRDCGSLKNHPGACRFYSPGSECEAAVRHGEIVYFPDTCVEVYWAEVHSHPFRRVAVL